MIIIIIIIIIMALWPGRFGSGRAYYRRYTKFFGNGGDVAQLLTIEALTKWRLWDAGKIFCFCVDYSLLISITILLLSDAELALTMAAIRKWQSPILLDSDLPLWYKTALFNELYLFFTLLLLLLPFIRRSSMQ